MTNRLLNLAAILSTIFLVVLIVAWFVAGEVQPTEKHLSLSSGCYLSIDAWGPSRTDARLEIFNDAQYGPYRGSIIEIAGPNYPSRISKITFGDTAGIYYRYFRWPDDRKLWTLSLSLIYPALVALAAPILCLVHQIRRGPRAILTAGLTAPK